MARQWLTTLWKRGSSDGGRRQPQRPQRQRIERYFECNWLSDWGEEQTRVSSISPTGCFIDSRFTVPPSGAHVPELSVALPSGCITVGGTVLSARPGVGFAVRFTEVDSATRARLIALVASRPQERYRASSA
jgi:hypothetical protein